MRFEIRPLRDADRDWARGVLEEHWGGVESVSRGRVHRADRLPGFVAFGDKGPVGLLSYHIEGDQCEVVTLDALEEGQGVGTALLEAALGAAREAGCRRLWLVTTNDNTPAIAFYRGRGLSIVAIHRGAMEESRRLKPTIPLTGVGGLPIRDEIEMEIVLAP
jgi:ribosomal protein S18 acetylase RimI-like enzyme